MCYSIPKSCLTCSCMRPRYKRLVDNIFPPIPQDGLVKNNMEKLTFYSLSSPEKLDRIGEYLFQRASRDISRRRIGFVVIAMEAMDLLLLACHAQTLNLFVESFLRMIQKLLESTEPDLQVLATQSFVKFANIEEDTPSYHRRYDFFVSKFSSMCHSNHSTPEIRVTIRTAGIKGLQGVIRKTVSDDLVENIWEPIHMDKIVPSLLYNMQNSKYYKREGSSPENEDKNDPAVLADACMRELVGRASFGHVRSVLKPVLRHLDLHNLWVPNDFAVHTFKIIMYSIQSQYSYAVVENLMAHLDENSESSAKIRTSITYVLSEIIAISAEESVGPSVLEVINSLLGHVRMSVTRRSPEQFGGEETNYREALIGCLGEFTAHLPDYQKVEIMVFIISKVPQGSDPSEALLQQMLLKSLLTVGQRYTNVAMNTTFPVSLLDPLLRLCVLGRVEMTLIIQDILQSLLDRHQNADKLSRPTIDVDSLEINGSGRCSRPDTMFMRKHGEEIYSCLLETLVSPNNTVESICAVYTTLALLAVELITAHTLTNYLAMIYSIQEVALGQNSLQEAQRSTLHCVVISLLVLEANLLQIPPLKDYAQQIVNERRQGGYYNLLPSEMSNQYDLGGDGVKEGRPEGGLPPKVLLEENALGDCLQAAGLDTTAMTRALTHRHSWVESTGVTMRGSVTDLNSTDIDSANSTPGLQRWAQIWLQEMSEGECMDSRVFLRVDNGHSYNVPFLPSYRPRAKARVFHASASYAVFEERHPYWDHIMDLDSELITKYPEEEVSFEAMKRVLSESSEAAKQEEKLKQEHLFKRFRNTPFQEIVENNTVADEESLATRLMEVLSKSCQNPTVMPFTSSASSQPIYEVLFPELFAY